MNSRQRLLAACNGQPVDRPPVWIMRQAGRTLPEYNALRQQHEFWDMVHSPELAAEATLQPVRRFPLDAAIIFSDILVIPAALGLQVRFEPAPVLDPPIRSTSDIENLARPDAEEALGYVARALRLTREQLGEDRALLGFAGAPFTVASYMVEGQTSRTHTKVKSLMYNEPKAYTKLATRISDLTAAYLELQLDSGADAVQLFDSWAGELSPGDFAQFALPYIQSIVERVRKRGAPVIYYVNGIGNLLDQARASGADVLGIDWRIELAEVRRRLGEETVVQGNLDPAVLFGAAELIRARTHAILNQTMGSRHILNLGHGLQPDTPLAGIAAFIESAQDWKEART